MNIIYTAITGQYDSLKPHPAVGDVRFIAFLDDHRRQSVEGWEVRSLTLTSTDPVRCAKRYKILAHEVVPEADYSLWVDGSIRIREGFDWDALVDTYLSSHDLALFRHYCRGCAYVEAEVCVLRGLDNRDIIRRQMQGYLVDGYPRDNGLVEASVVLRRHTPSVEVVNTAWWREISIGSRRDQLSLNYVLWKLGVGYQALPGSLQANVFFERLPHQVSRSRVL